MPKKNWIKEVKIKKKLTKNKTDILKYKDEGKIHVHNSNF